VHLNIQFSRGSAATCFRWGGSSNTTFFCSSSKNITVKELLKSVHTCGSYEVKYACLFFSEKPCKSTYLTFQVSQGIASTDLRWGENFNKFLFRKSLLYIVVKKLRKSVNIFLSYRKNKSVSFFMAHSVNILNYSNFHIDRSTFIKNNKRWKNMKKNRL